jgi:hypothetical protein
MIEENEKTKVIEDLERILDTHGYCEICEKHKTGLYKNTLDGLYFFCNSNHRTRQHN